MRRLVRWLSLTFLDFVLFGLRGCGLTCAAHIAGATKSPPTITTRRRQRVRDLNIPGLFLWSSEIRSSEIRSSWSCYIYSMHEACQLPAPVA